MFRCKHDWEVKSDVILSSGYEQLIKAGQYIGHMKNYESLFQKTHILTIVCIKCGKVKTIKNVSGY